MHKPSMLLKNSLRQVEHGNGLSLQVVFDLERWPFQAIAASGSLLWFMNRTNRNRSMF